MSDKKFKLVYIDGPWAYFSSIEDITKQWGDDWNDAPYEHNAGTPYEWAIHREVPQYDIIKVAWDGGDLRPPCDGALNSQWSVQDINEKATPWLRTPDYLERFGKKAEIWAGTTLEEFIQIVNRLEGEVYSKVIV